MDDKYLNQLLAAAVKSNASDIHFKVGSPPMFRLNGELVEVKTPRLTPEDTNQLAKIVIANEKLRSDPGSLREFDGSYSIRDVGRFRVNVFRQRGSIAAVMRAIPFNIPTFDQLGMPKVLEKICDEERGLILVTGVTGSGKSSTLAAMIGYINNRRKRHIITVEDPIEFLHRDIKSSITQREIGSDTESFSSALRAALRQDPDIILVGEMRDYETIDIALKAAETGHLVFSTVHTTDATKTINRLIGVFPSNEQGMVRLRLADNLKASVSQRLLPRKDGKGRTVACEIMRATLTMQECIADHEKTSMIQEFIEKGSDQYGMQSFDQHLTALYRGGIVDLDVAKAAASNPGDFERALHFE